MSPYERGLRGNALGGDGKRLPNGGNTEVGKRGSGRLAVSSPVWVAGLKKPAQRHIGVALASNR